MDRDQANAARLRINRITLIQQLDSEELIPKLIHREILSPDDDIPYIKQGSSKIDRARRLIDCLLNENIEHPYRPANWFLVFRNILLENPTAYTQLVNILDQTSIRKSDSIPLNKDIQVEDHHHITNIQFDRYTMNKISVEGNFHTVIDHLTYYSQVLNKQFFCSPCLGMNRFSSLLNNCLFNLLNRHIRTIENNLIKNEKHSIKSVD